METIVYTVEETMQWEYNVLLIATDDFDTAMRVVEETCKKFDHGSQYGYPINPEVDIYEDELYTAQNHYYPDDMVTITLKVWK